MSELVSSFRIETFEESVRIHAEGLRMAPSRAWFRERNESGEFSFHRNLSRGEVLELFSEGKSPSDLDGAKWSNPDFKTQVTLLGEMLEPAIKLSHSNGKFLVRFCLKKSTSGETFTPPKNLENAISQGYAVTDGFFLTYDPQVLRSARRIAKEIRLGDLSPNAQHTTFRGYRQVKKALQSNYEISLLNEVDEEVFLAGLKASLEETAVKEPDGLSISLYPYQRKALDWLCFCHANELGGILADDMGLGKTATVIAFLSASKTDAPSLVCCPSTLLVNWRREFEKFCPSLKITVNHGGNRLHMGYDFSPGEVILTSYSLIRNDFETLSRIDWNVIALDEAQTIKNPKSGVSMACRKLNGSCKVAMTGTPFENRPLDLWSLMDFVEPGYLGSRDFFEHTYARPIEAGYKESIGDLESRVNLLMMRRMKSEVKSDLPDKIEIEQPVSLSEEEAELYVKTIERLKESSKSKGHGPNLITPLRQLCCHPLILEESQNEDPVLRSAKYRKFIYLLERILEVGEKALVFASYTKMLDILETDVPARLGIPAFRIDGSVPNEERQPAIDAFSKVEGSSLMVLNPTAAGVGLNITSANHVIHYNREWNPAKEDQATDRAYRIGQDKQVFVHYMYYEDTIEQLVSERLDRKRNLAGGLIKVTEDKESDQELVLQALRLIPDNLINDKEDQDLEASSPDHD